MIALGPLGVPLGQDALLPRSSAPFLLFGLAAALGIFLLVSKKPKRTNLRGHRFDPLGTPKSIGRVDDYGTTQSATIYVGQDRGLEPANRAGACRRKPKEFSVTSVDRVFLRLRERQVGKQATGATRTTGKGWYQGKPERAAAYEVVYIPNNREGDYSTFRANINQLAEKLGREFCQDSVIVVHNDGGRRQTCAATWFEPGESTC